MSVIRIRWNQFLEELRERNLSGLLRKAAAKFVQFDRLVVPTRKDLASVKEPAKPASDKEIEFFLVDKANVDKVALLYTVRSRKLKAFHNTALGYVAFVVAADKRIVGDIWCAMPKDVRVRPIHPDLEWLGIRCGENEAYMFDMYLNRDARGMALSNYLLGKSLFTLKENGCATVYGFYEKDNIPAMWAHRVTGYKELGTRRVRRLLFYCGSEPVSGGPDAAKKGV